jgi:lysophospholipase L1-like esterase
MGTMAIGELNGVKWMSLSRSSAVKYILMFCFLVLVRCAPNEILSEPVLGETDLPAFHYLALGDSYTIGESVAGEDRWPNQLAKLLDAHGIPVDLTIIARTGWTTSELWQGIQAEEIHPPYDLVSLLIGVNNQYRGYDIDEYRDQFHFLLNKSIEYANGDAKHVIVLSIPDWGVTPFASNRDREQIAGKIDEFNSVNRELSGREGAHYVDVTPISREIVNDPGLTAPDGLHPSGKMYAMWAEKTLPIVKEILIGSKQEKP